MKQSNRTTAAGPQNPAASESRRRAALLMQAIIGCAIANGIKDYQALADKSGMTRPQVSNYARGKAQPSAENLLRLAAAAGAQITVTNGLKEGPHIKI